jgi:hypothetical protein
MGKKWRRCIGGISSLILAVALSAGWAGAEGGDCDFCLKDSEWEGASDECPSELQMHALCDQQCGYSGDWVPTCLEASNNCWSGQLGKPTAEILCEEGYH